MALAATLTAGEQEVLAYLLSGGGSWREQRRRQAHPPELGCDCFGCYKSFWARWDASPNRHVIHRIIDAVEESLESRERGGGRRRKRRERKGCDLAAAAGEEILGSERLRLGELPPLEVNVKEKLSLFCHVPVENIITLHDVTNIWHIPLVLREQKAHEALLKLLHLQRCTKEPQLVEWMARAKLCDMLHDPVKIAIVGKYTGLPDSYLSVLKALLHASVACRKNLVINWVPSSDLEETSAEEV